MQMPVFSRLSAYAVAVGALLAGTGAAAGRPRTAGALAARPAAVRHPRSWPTSPRFITSCSGSSPRSRVFVLVLLLIVMVRFNARANPTPSRTTHNTLHRGHLDDRSGRHPGGDRGALVPAAVPRSSTCPKPDLTVKATGKQWYWSYNYPDNGNFEFNSLMVEDKDLKPGQPRLLTVDNEMVVPVNKVVHVLVTGADVIHSFAVPSFGIKIDAVPGRLNDTWFKATSEGLFHGQCSELCGKDHAFMPITVRVGERRRLRRMGRDREEERRPRQRSADRDRSGRRAGALTTLRRQEHSLSRDRKWIRWHTRHTATTTGMPSRTAGAAMSIRRTTRTSARCTWCSR